MAKGDRVGEKQGKGKGKAGQEETATARAGAGRADGGRTPGTAAATVAVIGGSGEARRRAEAARPKLLSAQEISRAVRQLGGSIGTKNHVGGHHVSLSAQVPWVDGRGYLNLINPQSFFSDGPNVGFISPTGGNVEGGIEVWLLGLETGGTYFLQFRVSSYSLDPSQPGLWEVRSSEGPAVLHPSTGPDQVVLAVLDEVSGPLALVKLTSTGLGGWVFFDVDVVSLS